MLRDIIIMDSHNLLKDQLLEINGGVTSLIADAKSVYNGISDQSFDDWEKICGNINQQVSRDLIRVAVVGPIKSGKSTFTNSIFQGDYLKRGAGVITSIVTKIRNGDSLQAKIIFKSWDEVNSDIEQAMVLFPALTWYSEEDRFDIRRKKDRSALQQELDSLSSDLLVSEGRRDVNSVLLIAFLKGYERIKDIISSETRTVQYDKKTFAEHRAFAGDDSMAVYLKDIQLQINSGIFNGDIEVADCQGSDSPNPLHLMMIQDYLLLTHLIVYVISSRTGLRQADIKFLSLIKKMGIIDNIMFVINSDFNEHESMDDLNVLIGKVKEELSFIKSDPDIYTLSALLNLFRAQSMNKEQEVGLSPKDRLRLTQWESENGFREFSNSETERFQSAINHKIFREHASLLLKNHLERLGRISSGFEYWIGINKDILLRDTDSAIEIIDKITRHKQRMDQIESMVQSTLDGALKKIKKDLKADVDRFFDFRSGNIIKDIVKYVRQYAVDYNEYEKKVEVSGFSNTMYMIFQEFKQSLDLYMTETINPEIISFIKTKENQIKRNLEAIAEPYDVLIHDALVEYNNSIKKFGMEPVLDTRQKVELREMDVIKGMIGLTLPPAIASMRYTARIKTEAVMRFGIYSVLKAVKKIFKKSVNDNRKEEGRALRDSVVRLKRETEKAIVSQYKSYKENIKFQYILKLVDAASKSLSDLLHIRFQAYSAGLSSMVELVSSNRLDKEQVSEMLIIMEKKSGDINEQISDLRSKMI